MSLPSVTGPDGEVAGTPAPDARGIAAGVDMQRIEHALAGLPTAPLLRTLDAILRTLDATDAQRSRRRAGLIGRLLGRDLVARAEAESAERDLRVHLVAAAAQAEALARDAAQLDALREELALDAAALDERIGTPSPGPGEAGAASPDDAALRRLEHLRALAASWQVALAQMRMASAHARRVLERHAQVRDLLVPLWRQQRLAGHVRTQLEHEEATRMQDMRRDIGLQLAALDAAGTPPPHSAPSPDREPPP